MSKYDFDYKRRARIFLSFYLVVILMTLLTVASYTWFSLSRTPRVSDMNMYINTPTGLELATDPSAADQDWTRQLDFRTIVEVTTPLRPVTWVDSEQRFYAATYGIDGRLNDYDQWQPLTDERNANKDNLDGYYIKATFYARSGMAVDIALSPAVEVDEGINGSGTYVIGTPLWDAQEILHNNGGQGAECAIRIGIRITRLDVTNQEIADSSEFFIYEPNSDMHTGGQSGYVATPSIRGDSSLIDEAHLIRQTASTWEEAYPVQRNVIVRDLGEFETETDLFSMKTGEIVKIDLYIWLEGQDVDCTNQINDAQIIANIQFSAESGNQSGMETIPTDPTE